MPQQIIALAIIAFFIWRQAYYFRKEAITRVEFIFWIIFWTGAALAVVFIKDVDAFFASIGFSGSGINILLYVAVVVLLYLFFKLRLKMEKIERDITKIVEETALNRK